MDVMNEEQFKQVATLVGDPTRAAILWTLLDGRAFTATELSLAANTTPQNTSMHVNKLVQAGWLSVQSQGRHRYYSFSRKEIAYAIEALGNLIPAAEVNKTMVTENNGSIKYCRTCYDHLAGKVGVLITERLIKQQVLVEKENVFEVSRKGAKFFLQWGIDTAELEQQRRSFARPCLDWSERRHHTAGSLGASMLQRMLKLNWLRKSRHARIVMVTPEGQKALRQYLKLDV